MATIQAGSVGRTDISSHTGSLDRRDNAQFKSVVTVSGSEHITSNYYATGSLAGSKGFIIELAANTVITPIRGGAITAGDITAKELYPIGVQRVSGGGRIAVIY
jgi:hypothetical protein